MGHNRRHAALAALCVLAVLLAASLFPASGFGTYPAGVWSDRGAGAPAGGAGPGAGQDAPDVPTGTSTTETTHRTTTETTAPADDADSGGGDGSALATVFAAAGLVLAGLVAAGFWTGSLAVSSTSSGGGLPFTVTVGGTPLGRLVGGLPERTMTLVVGFSSAVPQLLDDAASLAGEVGHGAAVVAGAAGRALGRTARFGASGLGAAFVAVPRALAGLSGAAGVLSGLGGGLSLPSLGRGSKRRASPTGGDVDAEPVEPEPPSVEEAWEAMADRVYYRRRRSRTPGEVARTAVERGYPADAVRQLTDAFREVRYGGFPRSERTSAARSALDRLRRYWEDDE